MLDDRAEKRRLADTGGAGDTNDRDIVAPAPFAQESLKLARRSFTVEQISWKKECAHAFTNRQDVRRPTFLAGMGAVTLSPNTSVPQRLRIDAAPLGAAIDPYRHAERGVAELAWLYADGLVGWTGSISPSLAREMPVGSDDGLTYHYVLRQGVWHDGASFTARDVERALAEVTASPWGGYEPYRSIQKLTVTGNHAFNVRLGSPRPGFVRSFFAPYGSAPLPIMRRAVDGTPIGTGPFAVASRPETERWTLRAVATSPRGIPRVAEIGLRLVLSEITANVQVASGEAHIALPLPPDVVTLGHFGTRYRIVNRLSSTEILLLNAERAFRRAEDRRALAASINVPYLQRIFERRPTVLDAKLTLSGTNDRAYERLLEFEPARIPSLRRALGDRELELTYVAQSPGNRRVMTEVHGRLRLMGLNASLRPIPGEHYYDENRPLRTGDFDIASYGLAYGDDADLAGDWASDALPPRGGNFSRWHDEKTDRALRTGDSGMALRRLYDEVACIVLGPAVEKIGVADQVMGFATPPLLVPATYSCAQWRLV